MAGYAVHFGHFLSTAPWRLHVAAHSHHPWPDVTLDAQRKAWLDAALLMDDKWDRVFGEVVPEAQTHVARRLGLSDASTVAFAPDTHSLVMRLLSCLDPPFRILATDAEFHSFARQARRLEEDGLAAVERVAAEPFETFPERFGGAVAAGGHDVVFFSHVHYNSGYVTPDLEAIVAAVPSGDTLVVIDAYHGFMALPTDLSAVEARAFYTAGGYKYAMAGEGAAFLHCPPGYALRPRDTGWFAGFGELSAAAGPGGVAYPADGRRFLGGTFDPTGLYRFNAVQRWMDAVGLTVEAIHDHVARLQAMLLDALAPSWRAALLPREDVAKERGHFLTFRRPDAGEVYRRLHEDGVITDYRDDRLRVGFGIYHDDGDVEELARRLARVASPG